MAVRTVVRGARGVAWSLCTLLAGGCQSGSSSGGGTGETDADAATGASGDASTGDGDDTDTEGGADPVPPPESGVGPMGMRRLTQHEYDATVADLVGDDTPRASLLPEDKLTPFDNDYTLQAPSTPLIEGVELLAKEVAQDLIADEPRKNEVVGCMAASATDEDCMRSFIAHFGRLAVRRPLETSEVEDFVALGLEYAAEDGFDGGVEVIVRAFLQHPEFLYRVERGTPVDDTPGVFRLNDYEVATRMSYLFWGSTPDDGLLDAAENGELTDPASRASVAMQMLEDPRARTQVERFHALWLGFSQLPHPTSLSQPMREETAALIDEVIFEDDASWLDLFTSTRTWVDDTLAEHYGLPSPSGAQGWVDYGDSGRQGLLSHGAFLSVAANPGDTSPTKRGILVRNRLMCSTVPDPPPDVNVDEPPGEEAGECKEDQYREHSNNGACKACHDLVDPIGFGLENYDRTGAFREHDDGKPECAIEGQGELVGVGVFSGPAELADLLVSDGALDACATEHLYRYAMGRETVDEDQAFLDQMSTTFVDVDHRFGALLVELVANEAFGFRLEEDPS